MCKQHTACSHLNLHNVELFCLVPKKHHKVEISALRETHLKFYIFKLERYRDELKSAVPLVSRPRWEHNETLTYFPDFQYFVLRSWTGQLINRQVLEWNFLIIKLLATKTRQRCSFPWVSRLELHLNLSWFDYVEELMWKFAIRSSKHKTYSLLMGTTSNLAKHLNLFPLFLWWTVNYLSKLLI